MLSCGYTYAELFAKLEEVRSQSDTVDCVGQLLLDWVSMHTPGSRYSSMYTLST